MRRARIAVALLTALTVTVGAGCSGTAKSDADLELVTDGKITAVALSTQYPMSMVVDGKVQGMAIDLIDEVGRRLDLEVTYRVLDLPSSLPGIQANRYDVGAFGMNETPERAKVVAFSDPWYWGSSVLIVRKADGHRGFGALAGKTVAVGSQSTQEEYLRENQPEIRLKTFPTDVAQLGALSGKQVDGVYIGSSQLPRILQKYPHFTVAERVESAFPNSLPMRKQSPQFVRAVNRELDAMFADGTWLGLYRRWLPGEPVPSRILRDHPDLREQATATPTPTPSR